MNTGVPVRKITRSVVVTGPNTTVEIDIPAGYKVESLITVNSIGGMIEDLLFYHQDAEGVQTLICLSYGPGGGVLSPDFRGYWTTTYPRSNMLSGGKLIIKAGALETAATNTIYALLTEVAAPRSAIASPYVAQRGQNLGAEAYPSRLPDSAYIITGPMPQAFVAQENFSVRRIIIRSLAVANDKILLTHRRPDGSSISETVILTGYGWAGLQASLNGSERYGMAIALVKKGELLDFSALAGVSEQRIFIDRI